MTPLQDILEQRLTAASGTAEVSCGTLGVLRVEGLSPREFALLSRGDDSPRRVLYAACRQLQLAGAALQERGLLFHPEQIMDYVTGPEVMAAYEVIAEMSCAGQESSLVSSSAYEIFQEQSDSVPPTPTTPHSYGVPDDTAVSILHTSPSDKEEQNTPLAARPGSSVPATQAYAAPLSPDEIARQLLEGLQRAAATAG